jgi:ribosome-binding protein aMBF1 (putative translation factor)
MTHPYTTTGPAPRAVRRKAPISPLGQTVADDTQARMADPEFRRAWDRYAVAEEVALTLIRFRVKRGLSQKAAAGVLGMTESMVSRLERGDHIPNVRTMLRVAEATGTRLTVRFDETK